MANLDMLGENLANAAKQFKAVSVRHAGGHAGLTRYIATNASGDELRLIADEGIGSIEGEDGFDEVWNSMQYDGRNW